MAPIRLFITDAEALPAELALRSTPRIIEVERLDVPPPTIAGSEKWPPDWVGFAPSATQLHALRQHGEGTQHIALALQGTDLLSDPQFAGWVDEAREEGYTVDLVVYLGSYGGAV